MPTVALNGTDILHVRPDLKTVNCPYTMKSDEIICSCTGN